MTAPTVETPALITDVIDSPACSMPQFSDYRRHYYLVAGSYALTSAATLDDIIERATPYATQPARIVRVPVVPYYDTLLDDRGQPKRVRSVGTAPWAGGTWSGRCGATVWVRDDERQYRSAFATLRALGGSRYMQTEPVASSEVKTTQAWWSNGVADREESLDGFWVECTRLRREHTGLCSALDITWDWRDYAPWTDQVAGAQLSFDLTWE